MRLLIALAACGLVACGGGLVVGGDGGGGTPDGASLDSDAGARTDGGSPGDPDAGATDAGSTADAGSGLDAGSSSDAGGGADGGSGDCSGPGPGCTCVSAPGGGSCDHTFGGVYADGACSASYQCCAGSWRSGTGVCGACVCTEPTGTVGCSAGGAEVCFPSFVGRASPLPAAVRTQMTGLSWRSGCPVPLDDLSLLTVSHWTFAGDIATGELVVASRVADTVLAAMESLYVLQFPIERMQLVDDYGADDDASMEANNTSAFNCRYIGGTTSWSEHAYGTAIDINPVQNPYVSGTFVAPPAGADYVDRSNVRPGMLLFGPLADSFKDLGWGWGGDWASKKDYQHFSESGG